MGPYLKLGLNITPFYSGLDLDRFHYIRAMRVLVIKWLEFIMLIMV